MIGFLPSFSAEVVIWGSLWWPCWRSEERQSAGLTLAVQYSQNTARLEILKTSLLLQLGTEPIHFPLLIPICLFRWHSCTVYLTYTAYRPIYYHCNRNRSRHWEVSAERTLIHRTCLLSYSLLSHTPLWPNAGELLGLCYIFNESRVFDLPMFIFFDVNWHSREQPALNVVQHEDRLIHYPLTGDACGWGVHPWGLIISTSLEWLYLLQTCCISVSALWPLWANAHDCRRRKFKRIVSQTPFTVPAVDLSFHWVFIRHWVNRE